MEQYPNHYQKVFAWVRPGYPENTTETFRVEPDPLAPVIDEDWDAYLEYGKLTLTDTIEVSVATPPAPVVMIQPDDTGSHTIALRSPNFAATRNGYDIPHTGTTTDMCVLAFFELPNGDSTAINTQYQTVTASNNIAYHTLTDPYLFRRGGTMQFAADCLDSMVNVLGVDHPLIWPMIIGKSGVISLKFVKRRNIPRKNPKFKHYG